MDENLRKALEEADIGFNSSPEPERAQADDLSEEELNTEVVILLQGKNRNGDEIYSYLKLLMSSVFELRDAIITRRDFSPSDFGDVLAAGLGEPSPELRSEMAVKYDLVDMKPQAKPKKINFAQAAPDMWGDE